MNFISIIVPTYNRSSYIAESIESVLNQTYNESEIIVVDDGSTDNTYSILAPYIKTNRLRYFRQPNTGVSSARNLGISESKGQFIAFLDSDDKWLPNHLEDLVNALATHKQTKIAFTDFSFFGMADESGRLNAEFSQSMSRVLKEAFLRIESNIYFSQPNLLETLFLRGFPFRCPTAMVERKFLHERNLNFLPSISYTEDAQFFTEAALYTPFLFINHATVLVRRHSGNYRDMCYSKKILDSYDARVRRLSEFFPRKCLSKTEMSALKYLLWDLQAHILQNRVQNDPQVTTLLRESANLVHRVPSISSLKSIIKVTLFYFSTFARDKHYGN